MAESDSSNSSLGPSSSAPKCLVCEEFKHYKVYLSEAKKAARSGCEPCAILVSAAEEVVQQEQKKSSRRKSQKTGEDSFIRVDSVGNSSSSISVNDDSDDFNIFTTSKSSPWKPIKCMRRRSSHSGSPEIVELISEWWKECSVGHSKCRQSPAPLPTRIIDIGCLPGDIPKLCSGGGKSEPYCALSHCWGSSQPLCTTKDTLSHRESGMPQHLLPQTFQDAIVVSRRLSIRYLWIDSLCIIQGDDLDWQRESARMADVYGNASLVISATHAAQCSAGCFSKRSPSAAPVLCYTHKTSNDDEVPIYVEPVSGIHMSYEPSSLYNSKPHPWLPVLSRSWCFQERLLATRVLHFAGEDLVWECRSKTLCECMGLNLENNMKTMKERWVDEPQSYDLWHKLLKIYLSRDITYPSDRLPAISGVVQQMKRAGLGDYFAGIWKENLFADLLWTPFHGPRVEKWQAPSWSWACLYGSIELSHAVQNDNSPESFLDHVNLRQRNTPGLDCGGNLFTATLRKIESTPEGVDRTGKVASASLTISVPLITASISPDPRNAMGYSKVDKDGVELECRHDCDEDFAELEKGRGDIVCIWIGTIWEDMDDETPWPQLMVLRESIGIGGVNASPGAYERIGIMSLKPGLDEKSQADMIVALVQGG